ncbi:hypothetical protein LXL04_038213 [Taraxacum kok-saghyz]
MNTTDRNWMYERLGANGFVSPIFRSGLNTYIEFACSNQNSMDGNKIKCLCTKCLNKPYADVEVVKYHLARFGFMQNYHLWDRHGETSVRSTSTVGSTSLGLLRYIGGNIGRVRVHNQYKLVDVDKRRKFNKFEPFVLAMQVTQVCYIPYPSMKTDNSHWLAVCKVKPRGWVDVENGDYQKDVAFQEDEVEANEIISTAQEPSTSSLDATSGSGNMSSTDSDDENNDVDEGELECSTSTDEQEDDGDDDQFDNDTD